MDILKKAKERNLHTAIETCGFANTLTSIIGIEIEPYHAFGENKYLASGKQPLEIPMQTDEQINEIIASTHSIPQYEYKIKHYVENFEDTDIIPDDTVTFKIIITRKNVGKLNVGITHSKYYVNKSLSFSFLKIQFCKQKSHRDHDDFFSIDLKSFKNRLYSLKLFSCLAFILCNNTIIELAFRLCSAWTNCNPASVLKYKAKDV